LGGDAGGLCDLASVERAAERVVQYSDAENFVGARCCREIADDEPEQQPSRPDRNPVSNTEAGNAWRNYSGIEAGANLKF
jgi:hypothetical protein